MATLTQTIARAKLPNETMTQTLHRLRKDGETITQTAGRLAKGDIDVEVVSTTEPELITAPDEPTTVDGSNTDIDEVVEEVTQPEQEEELTPQQKAAITRAKNKAAKEAAEKKKDK